MQGLLEAFSRYLPGFHCFILISHEPQFQDENAGACPEQEQDDDDGDDDDDDEAEDDDDTDLALNWWKFGNAFGLRDPESLAIPIAEGKPIDKAI